ncbi:unnamed protein product [[Actinomadura] parvosata subsp. kistnae]|nr:unnamed protein product [Actinomadura parvosata subsp. kistnae]
MGELTALVPFGLVDAVLEETRGVQRRLRAPPSRAGVYVLPVTCLFAESGYARRLPRPDMLVLWDKGFDGNAFLAQVDATGAQVLGRLRSNRRTPILAIRTDGSSLSLIGNLGIRVIEARITVTCTDGATFTGTHRLVTPLDRRPPSPGRRSGQALPPAMGTRAPTAAASPSPCTPPATWSFRWANGPGSTTGVVATIGRRVLVALLPSRRPRVSTRKVTSPTSRSNERLDDGRPVAGRLIRKIRPGIYTAEPLSTALLPPARGHRA